MESERRRTRAGDMGGNMKCHRRMGVTGALVLAVALTVSRPRPAYALDPVTAISAIQKAYSIYTTAKGLFGDTGPSTAQLIQQAVNNLITYMNTIRDQQWKTAAKAAADDLASLALHQPADPTNPNLFNNIWTNLSSGGIDAMYTVLIANDDALGRQSDYQAAPVLNEMAAAWIGLLLMKGQIWPAFPSTFGEYNLRTAEVMDLNYHLVGAQSFMCWPGWDPGAGAYLEVLAPAFGVPAYSDLRATYRSQMYWYLKDVLFTLSQTKVFGVVVAATYAYPTKAISYNWTLPLGYIPVTDRATALSNLQRARALADPLFSSDAVVQIIRAGMKGLMSVGGLNRGTDSSIVPYHSFVDPIVADGVDCSSYSSSEYVITP
jgi:hypothetical protein